MSTYILKRVLIMIPISLVLSFVCFLVVELAPGDFTSIYRNRLIGMTATQDQAVDESQRQAIEGYLDTFSEQYGLDKPFLERYAIWITGIITRGDFGYNLTLGRPVSELIQERLGWTVLLSVSTLSVTFIIGLVLGVYSATHQYSPIDYLVSVVSFFGMSVPSFFTALAAMVFVVVVLNGTVGGFFSTRYVAAPWSVGKFLDLLAHLALPLFVAVLHSTAGVLRITRSQMLDIIHMPYIQAARAKGLRERVVVYKHALRNALHPLVMGMGYWLPEIIAGETILSIVMGLPTVGLMFYEALIDQDSYTAGAGLLISAVLLQVGNLLADLALAWLDPTIAYE